MAKNASFFIYSIELFTWSQYQMFYAASHYPPNNQYIRSRTTMRKQIEPSEVWNAKTEPGKLEPRRIHHRVSQLVPSPTTKAAWIDHCWYTHMQRLLICKENKREKAGCYRLISWMAHRKEVLSEGLLVLHEIFYRENILQTDLHWKYFQIFGEKQHKMAVVAVLKVW
jgi:hypothetical protein